MKTRHDQTWRCALGRYISRAFRLGLGLLDVLTHSEVRVRTRTAGLPSDWSVNRRSSQTVSGLVRGANQLNDAATPLQTSSLAGASPECVQACDDASSRRRRDRGDSGRCVSDGSPRLSEAAGGALRPCLRVRDGRGTGASPSHVTHPPSSRRTSVLTLLISSPSRPRARSEVFQHYRIS